MKLKLFIMRLLARLGFLPREILYICGSDNLPAPLCREDEEKAIAALENGDDRGKQTLIEHNLRLCAHIARKYTIPGYEAEDLISIGTVGLIKGINTFKVGSGTQLSTYCARCIENPMRSPA